MFDDESKEVAMNGFMQQVTWHVDTKFCWGDCRGKNTPRNYWWVY